MVSVGDLAVYLGVPVLFQRPRGGIEVDHDLDGVAGAVVAGLGIDDDGFVFAVGDDVRPASQRRGLAAEFKPVLCFDVDLKAADRPVLDSLVDEGGVVEHPLGLVEVRWDAFPALVMGLEPDGPLAGVLTGEEAGQPGGPDVGEVAANSRHGFALAASVVGDSSSLLMAEPGPLRAAVIKIVWAAPERF